MKYMNWYGLDNIDLAVEPGETGEFWHKAVSDTEVKLEWVFYQGPRPYLVTWEHPQMHQAHWNGEWNMVHSLPSSNSKKRARFGTYIETNPLTVNGNNDVQDNEHPYRVRQNRGLNFLMYPYISYNSDWWRKHYQFQIKLYPDFNGSPPNMSQEVTYTPPPQNGNAGAWLLFRAVLMQNASNSMLEHLAKLEQDESSSNIKKLKLLKELEEGRLK